MGDFNAEEANIHIKDLYKLKNVIIKVQHVLKIQDYWSDVDKLSLFSKLMYTLKQVFLTFIKWLLLSLNHTWKRNNLKSYL